MVAPKRREKMACQRSKTPKKRRERKRGNHVSKKRETGMVWERKAITSRNKPYSSICPSIHTLAPFDRDCMTCFFLDPLFDFTIYVMQVCSVLILPWAPQKLYVVVGKTEGRYCPGKDSKHWVLRENHLENFAMFLKNFQKMSPDGLQIYEQVSIALCTILTLNSPKQRDS